MLDPSNMSDASLDRAYADAFDAHLSTDSIRYAQEIIARLAGVWSFVTGTVGYVRFPLYDARGRFHQVSESQGAVKASAAVLADKATFWGGSALLVAALVAGSYILWKIKK